MKNPWWTIIAAIGCLFFNPGAHGASGRIVKTLPHFLDLKGRHTIHPSLFARDAYQADLKSRPDLCSGMRFDVQWKARDLKSGRVRIQLEARGSQTPPRQIAVFEKIVPSDSSFSRWTGVEIAGPDFTNLGSIVAWRITLWDGPELFAEQKSFLWEPPGRSN